MCRYKPVSKPFSSHVQTQSVEMLPPAPLQFLSKCAKMQLWCSGTAHVPPVNQHLHFKQGYLSLKSQPGLLHPVLQKWPSAVTPWSSCPMLILQIPDTGGRMCITQNVSDGTDTFPSTQAKWQGRVQEGGPGQPWEMVLLLIFPLLPLPSLLCASQAWLHIRTWPMSQQDDEKKIGHGDALLKSASLKQKHMGFVNQSPAKKHKTCLFPGSMSMINHRLPQE